MCVVAGVRVLGVLVPTVQRVLGAGDDRPPASHGLQPRVHGAAARRYW